MSYQDHEVKRHKVSRHIVNLEKRKTRKNANKRQAYE